MVEYGLIVAFVAMVSLSVIGWVGAATGDRFEDVAVGLGAQGGGGVLTGSEAEQSDTAPGGGDSVQDDETDSTPTGPGSDTSGLPSDEGAIEDQGELADGDVDESEPPGDSPSPSPAVVAQTASYSSWETRKGGGGDGAWDASVTFYNAATTDQVLTLEVNAVDEKGKKTTTSVELTIAAGSEAVYESVGNEVSIRGNGKNFKGVVAVEVRLVSVTAATDSGEIQVQELDDPPVVIEAPETP